MSTLKTFDKTPVPLPAPGKRFFMLVLGFASGLPYAIFTGTIVAWLTDGGVTPSTIGVLSWAGLCYAFKFLWSPLISAINPNIARSMLAFGQLRAWMFVCQCAIIGAIVLISRLEAGSAIALIALLTVFATFASATQDIAIDAWRIKSANTNIMLDQLSALVQFGYRVAAFIGGAGVLIFADASSWSNAWIFTAIAMAVCLVTLFFIPDEPGTPKVALPHITLGAELGDARYKYTFPVVAIWVISLLIIFGFMGFILLADNPPSTREFTLGVGPLIVASCLLGPALASVLILRQYPKPYANGVPARTFTDRLYANLLEPMIDLIFRLRYAAILILALILSYRFADTVWGSFAYPFYLGAPETGGLHHTKSEIAVASKIFGVLMTITGTIMAAGILTVLGQMRSLVLGAILAAVTNLLYADLALGGARIDWAITASGLHHIYGLLNGLTNALEHTPLLAQPVEIDARMGRLMLVIAGENLAVGFASVVYVAYLSSMVNPKYAAVQYALLASLTMLIGVLGRGYLGELIELHGYAFVFVLTAGLGAVGVVMSIAEWVRQSRNIDTTNAPPRM